MAVFKDSRKRSLEKTAEVMAVLKDCDQDCAKTPEKTAEIMAVFEGPRNRLDAGYPERPRQRNSDVSILHHGHLLHQAPFTTFKLNTFYTRHLLHQTPVTPDNFYNKQLLHPAPFTPETFYTDTFYTRHL